MPGGFAGGFAEGFSNAFGQAQANKRFGEQMGLQQQQYGLDVQKFGEQKRQFQEDLKRRDEALSLQKAQQDALIKHQEFADQLAKRQEDLKLRQDDLTNVKDLFTVLKSGVTPQERAAKATLFALKMGVDPKDPTFKAIQDVLKTMPDDDLDNARKLIAEALPGMAPGATTAFAKAFLSDPGAALSTLSQLSKTSAASQETNPVYDPVTGKTTYATKPASVGQQVPPPNRLYATPEEAAASEDKKTIIAGVNKQATDTVDAFNTLAQMKPDLATFKRINDSGQFQTGFAAGPRNFAAHALQFLGMRPDEVDKYVKDVTGVDMKLGSAIGSAGAADVMDALYSKLGTQYAEKLSRLTNLGLTFIGQAMPGLSKTKEGNDLIVEMFQRASARVEDSIHLMDEYKDKYHTLSPGTLGIKDENGKLVPDWDTAVRRKDALDPLIPPEMEQKIKDLSAQGDKLNFKEVLGQASDAATGAAGAAAGAVGAATAGGGGSAPPAAKPPTPRGGVVTLGDPSVTNTQLQLKTTKVEGGHSFAVYKGEELPIIWTQDDVAKLPPGTRFIYGPAAAIGATPGNK